ncbi:MAG: DnaJ family domain-containing protein [Actinomycetota bacterium]
MSWIEIVADRKIRDAQEEGAFDNLPGKGKPLNLDFDPRVPPELRAAYRIMKDAQVLPEWIQLDKEIRQKQEQWEQRVADYASLREEALERRPARNDGPYLLDLDRARERFLHRAAEGLRERNRLIDRFNLTVPVISRQRVRIDVIAEMTALEERFLRLSLKPTGAEGSWRELFEDAPKPTRLGNRLPLRRKGTQIR